MNKEPKFSNDELRFLVKSYYNYQDMRIKIENRLKRKKDGKKQKVNKKNKDTSVADKNENKAVLEEIANDTRLYEKRLLKDIKNIVHVHPLWINFLKDVKGCGETLTAVLITEINIYKADTVSKMLAYAGICPGMTKGKKWNKAKTKIIITDTDINQDRMTPGFLSPYNSWLKSKIYVLAECFFLSKSPYAEIAYNLYIPGKYRTNEEAMKKRPELAGRYGRLDLSEQMTTEIKKGGKIVALKWKDCTPKHRQMASYRIMMKWFFKDLYVAWRTLEGLPVRKPYEEEYLGKKHGE